MKIMLFKTCERIFNVRHNRVAQVNPNAYVVSMYNVSIKPTWLSNNVWVGNINDIMIIGPYILPNIMFLRDGLPDLLRNMHLFNRD